MYDTKEKALYHSRKRIYINIFENIIKDDIMINRKIRDIDPDDMFRISFDKLKIIVTYFYKTAFIIKLLHENTNYNVIEFEDNFKIFLKNEVNNMINILNYKTQLIHESIKLLNRDFPELLKNNLMDLDIIN